MAFVQLQNFAQLSIIGFAHLEVRQGHRRRAAVPMGESVSGCALVRMPPLPMRLHVVSMAGSNHTLEDLKHFVLECLVFDYLHLLPFPVKNVLSAVKFWVCWFCAGSHQPVCVGLHTVLYESPSCQASGSY